MIALSPLRRHVCFYLRDGNGWLPHPEYLIFDISQYNLTTFRIDHNCIIYEYITRMLYPISHLSAITIVNQISLSSSPACSRTPPSLHSALLNNLNIYFALFDNHFASPKIVPYLQKSNFLFCIYINPSNS